MKISRKNLIFLAALIVSLPYKEKAKAAGLPNPTADDALATVEFNPTGVVVARESIFFTFPKNALYVRTPWTFKGRTPAEKFGGLLEQKRITIKAPPLGSRWVGGWTIGNQLVWLDGSELNTLAVGTIDEEEKTYRSVPWEGVLRPPRDRGGEAGRPEINAMRAKFKKEFMAAAPVRVSGVTIMARPEEDAEAPASKRGVFSLAVLTRLPSFPIGLLTCQVADPSQCVWERSCFAPKLGDNPDDLAGIAYDEDDKLLLVGSRTAHSIHVLKFNSCLSISSYGNLALPPKIKNISALAIDATGRLFVATSEADDYLNGSVFTWPSTIWEAAVVKNKSKAKSSPRH